MQSRLVRFMLPTKLWGESVYLRNRPLRCICRSAFLQNSDVNVLSVIFELERKTFRIQGSEQPLCVQYVTVICVLNKIVTALKINLDAVWEVG